MSTISAIRDGLQTRLATISGLRAHDVWPGIPVPPAAMVKPFAVGVDGVFSGEQMDTYEITLIVGKGTKLDASQDRLDGYVSRSGTDSIQAALEGDGSLGGAAQFLIWKGWTEYGGLKINDVEYLGAKGLVEVWH